MKRKAINHYNRMIKWAKTQQKGFNTFSSKMYEAIGETWFGEDCPYCKEYSTYCDECPLVVISYCPDFYPYPCSLTTCDMYRMCPDHGTDPCCNGLWGEMSKSQNWELWIINAEKVKKYIRKNG